MPKLPEIIIKEWENRQRTCILTTVDPQGNPNAVYVSCVRKYDESTMIIADNYFDKTKANILSGSKASLLFITKDRKSYQIKGSIKLHTSGVYFEDMKSRNPEEMPGHAAAVLSVAEAYSGAKQLL